jgi:hypothetical protein
MCTSGRRGVFPKDAHPANKRIPVSAKTGKAALLPGRRARPYNLKPCFKEVSLFSFAVLFFLYFLPVRNCFPFSNILRGCLELSCHGMMDQGGMKMGYGLKILEGH